MPAAYIHGETTIVVHGEMRTLTVKRESQAKNMILVDGELLGYAWRNAESREHNKFEGKNKKTGERYAGKTLMAVAAAIAYDELKRSRDE